MDAAGREGEQFVRQRLTIVGCGSLFLSFPKYHPFNVYRCIIYLEIEEKRRRRFWALDGKLLEAFPEASREKGWRLCKKGDEICSVTKVRGCYTYVYTRPGVERRMRRSDGVGDKGWGWLCVLFRVLGHRHMSTERAGATGQHQIDVRSNIDTAKAFPSHSSALSDSPSIHEGSLSLSIPALCSASRLRKNYTNVYVIYIYTKLDITWPRKHERRWRTDILTLSFSSTKIGVAFAVHPIRHQAVRQGAIKE